MIDIEELLRIAKGNGVNQRALCSRAGINKSTLYRIRKKQVKPRLDTMQKLLGAAHGK